MTLFATAAVLPESLESGQAAILMPKARRRSILLAGRFLGTIAYFIILTAFAIALLFLGLVIGYRSMYNSVPLLMAMGIAAVGSFMAYKSWRMLRDANVRGPFRQLKRDRRITPAGYAFFAATLAVLALGVHGGVMNYHLHRPLPTLRLMPE
jgi:hypothetical protein